MRNDRDAVSPWAFFLPIALAVLVGTLVADAVGQLMRDRFADSPAPVVTRQIAPVEIEAGPAAPAVVAPASPTDAGPATSQPVAAPIDIPHPDAEIPATPADMATASTAADPGAENTRRLSGPMTARQAGESESCINNTVATRSPNGWEQALENDAPVRCEADSP